jgi:hypothetical protein
MTTNQTKVYQLFKEIFGQINFSNIDVTLPSNSNLKTIQYLLTTQIPDITAMLNIITIYFNNNYNASQIANIFFNLGIITDINNPNFISNSINSNSAPNNSFNYLSRSLENADYFASIEPSILGNGNNILDFQKYTTIDQSNNNPNNFDQNNFGNMLYPNIMNPNQFLQYSNQTPQYSNQTPQYSNQNLQYFNQLPQYSNQSPQYSNQSPQYSNQSPQYSQMVQQPQTFQIVQPPVLQSPQAQPPQMMQYPSTQSSQMMQSPSTQSSQMMQSPSTQSSQMIQSPSTQSSQMIQSPSTQSSQMVQSPTIQYPIVQSSQMVQSPQSSQMIQPVENPAQTLQSPRNLSQRSQLPENLPQDLEPQKTLNQPASDFESINIELNKKIINLQYQLNLVKSNSTFDCKNKIDKASKDLSYQINDLKTQGTHINNNYLQLLFDLLLNNQLITLNEVENINRKLKSGDIDIYTIVSLLERKKELAKISFPNFNDIYLKKWTTPLPRPPICLSDNPIKLKQNDIYANNYSTFN